MPESRLLISEVIKDSHAEKAGLAEGDILLEYAGKPARTVVELMKIMNALELDEVPLVILRDSERIDIEIASGQLGVMLKEIMPEHEFDKDAVIIEGIPKLDWSTGKSNSMFAAMELAANHIGIEKDYTYIFGTSGAAFRLHFHKDWCPSSPDPGVGRDTIGPAFYALGIEPKFVGTQKPDEEFIAKTKKLILESIDKGKPVVAIDLIGLPEWGVIVGYQKNGDELICRTYFDRREGYEIAQKFPWSVAIIQELVEPPTDTANYRRSFEIAYEMMITPEYGAYLSGMAAIKYWLDLLQNFDFDSIPEPRYMEMSHANAWIYSRLVHDRNVAAEYLKRIAPKMPEIEGKLRELSELYRKESEVLSPSEDFVVYGYMMKSRDDWTQEMRDRQRKRLRLAQTLEEKARLIWEDVLGK